MIESNDMEISTIAMALVFCPILFNLPLNFIRFNWGFRRGMAPMPPDVEETAFAGDRIENVFDYVVLIAFVFLLLQHSRITVEDLGLSSKNWMSAVALGVLVGGVVIGGLNLAVRMTPEKASKRPESHGAAGTWCAIQILYSFAGELWRAFCIIGLIRLDLSALLAVLIAAAAWGSSRLTASVSAALGSAAFGVLAGFLFTRTSSFFAPLSLSLVTGGIYVYRVRRASRLPASDVHFNLTCPVCKTVFDRRAGERKKGFACPHCGEKLTYQMGQFSGLCAVVSLVVPPVLLYSLRLRGVALVLGSIAGIIAMLFLTTAIYCRLSPPELVQRSRGLRLTDGPRNREGESPK